MRNKENIKPEHKSLPEKAIEELRNIYLKESGTCPDDAELREIAHALISLVEMAIEEVDRIDAPTPSP